ncbi:uncharacterized protein K489DRAFT_128539 [Dissoconium aciculare CBS 342.82]|uniref:F-box domain-containing protein n=1 Tax=Dissoconium aciculare CBS 342.82 TaxID=1314786 RepID=A0A6J3LUI0_9PEZI|nr:uncharacterized protein K489DRAFT_128539 [Dissoconium aciculare CBS 342.82]KAF1818277.1 hypothetical protein K489DRAFT_128539 [Dissoconium aciculare CBS 342.82]
MPSTRGWIPIPCARMCRAYHLRSSQDCWDLCKLRSINRVFRDCAMPLYFWVVTFPPYGTTMTFNKAELRVPSGLQSRCSPGSHQYLGTMDQHMCYVHMSDSNPSTSFSRIPKHLFSDFGMSTVLPQMISKCSRLRQLQINLPKQR